MNNISHMCMQNFILLYTMWFQMIKTAYSELCILNPLDSDVYLYS